jgi:flagellar basal body-associated protein FliL
MTVNMQDASNCIIIPSCSNSLDKCNQIIFPSMSSSSMIILMIISWVIFLGVAYIIYWFLNNKTNTCSKYNYWAILGILLLATIIVNLATLFFIKKSLHLK